MSVAGAAQGSAAALDGARLLRPVELGRHTRSHPSCALCAVSRAGRARGQPDGGDHRQPKRQERRKRGASIDPPGYDAGKKIKGKKRHILVDTQGLLMHAIVHAADIQDRDGGAFVMATMFGMYPFLMKLYADGGYQGPLFRRAVAKIMAQVNIEIVKRSDHAKGFVVLPKRWVVNLRTMLPSWALSGRCSSSAEVVAGGRVSPR